MSGRVFLGGAHPYQMQNECSVSSSPHSACSIGARTLDGASVQVQSTAYRWPSGFCAVCAAFSSSTLVRPWTWPTSRPASGPSCSAASSPSASASESAITGSTRRSSPGRTPCSQVSNSTASSRRNVQVSCHIACGAG